MPVTMATILSYPARQALSMCLRCYNVTISDITFRQTFGYVVACPTSYATLWLYL